MPIKGQMVFQDEVEQQGWTETYYLPLTDINVALTQLESLATVRAQILSVRRSIGWIRASLNMPRVVPGPRRQRAAGLRRIDLGGSYSAGTGSPDVVFLAAKVRYQDTTAQIFRTFLLRGLDDSLWNNGDDKQAKAAFKQFLPKWSAALNGVGVFIWHLDRTTGVKVPVTIASAEYEGLTRRATGRALFIPRGRK